MQMPPPGACRRGCAPPSFLFLSSLRTRGSSIVVFVFVFPLSVILDISNRGSSVVVFVFPLSVILDARPDRGSSQRMDFFFCQSTRIQCRSLRKDRKKQRPWIPDRVGDDRREKTAPSNGAKSRAPAGAAAPQSRIFFGGEDCLSAALVLSNAKELSIKNRALGKADSFLRQTQDRREILRFAQDKLGMTTEWHPKGRAWAPMVLDPFAETKGSSPCGGETPQAFPLAVPETPQSSLHLAFMQTSPTIGMTIPVLAAPRTARRKNKEKRLTYAPAIRTIPTSLLKVLQSRIVPLLSNSSITEKGEEGLTYQPAERRIVQNSQIMYSIYST